MKYKLILSFAKDDNETKAETFLKNMYNLLGCA